MYRCKIQTDVSDVVLKILGMCIHFVCIYAYTHIYIYRERECGRAVSKASNKSIKTGGAVTVYSGTFSARAHGLQDTCCVNPSHPHVQLISGSV